VQGRLLVDNWVAFKLQVVSVQFKMGLGNRMDIRKEKFHLISLIRYSL